MINKKVCHAAVSTVTAGVLMSGCNDWSDPTEADARAESTETTNSIAGRPSESVSQGAAISDDEIGLSKSGETYPGAPFIPELGTLELPISISNFDFDPCADIPVGFFDQVGLGEPRKNSIEMESDTSCIFNPEIYEGYTQIGMHSSPNPSTGLETIPGTTEWEPLTSEVSILTNQTLTLGDKGCIASVDTVGGSLAVTLISFESTPEETDLCEASSRWLKTILKMDGK